MGERQTEPHQADEHTAWRERQLMLNEIAWDRAELARVRAERDEAKQDADTYGLVVEALWPYWSTLPSCPAPVAVEKLIARAEAAEARAENQAAEIVALIRSYADVHMTKALADLIEHRYIHGEEGR